MSHVILSLLSFEAAALLKSSGWTGATYDERFRHCDSLRALKFPVGSKGRQLFGQLGGVVAARRLNAPGILRPTIGDDRNGLLPTLARIVFGIPMQRSTTIPTITRLSFCAGDIMQSCAHRPDQLIHIFGYNFGRIHSVIGAIDDDLILLVDEVTTQSYVYVLESQSIATFDTLEHDTH